MFPLSIASARRAPRGRRFALSISLAFLASLGAARTLAAQRQLPGAPAGSTRATSSAPATSPDSPRAAVTTFLQLAHAGDYAHAGAYLMVPGTPPDRAAELARQLAAVLDQNVWIDPDELSGAAAGDTDDGLPARVEQIATIPGTGGAHEPVRMVRVTDESGPAWRFSASTVSRVPHWYASLDDQWVREHLPAVMLRTGPFGILWWQWAALPVVVALAVILGALLGRIARAVLAHVVRRTSAAWDDEIVSRLGAPLTLAASLIVASGLLGWLSLAAAARVTMGRLIQAGIFIAFFWGLWRLVDVGAQVLLVSRWAAPGVAGRSLLSLLSRAAKVAVLAIAIVAVLSSLGYPVAGLLTGLGLGGLAFALAAQKTVENLF
ncbi:MAG TPA: hypothetical protein VFS44_13050, partial [Gemmatimonadaceae bacterium]|nr:hypothetical protein [Gemmatimonadaceae bacterium]